MRDSRAQRPWDRESFSRERAKAHFLLTCRFGASTLLCLLQQLGTTIQADADDVDLKLDWIEYAVLQDIDQLDNIKKHVPAVYGECRARISDFDAKPKARQRIALLKHIFDTKLRDVESSIRGQA